MGFRFRPRIGPFVYVPDDKPAKPMSPEARLLGWAVLAAVLAVVATCFIGGLIVGPQPPVLP